MMMNNGESVKRFVREHDDLNLNFEHPKLIVAGYFDSVINKIDLNAETLLADRTMKDTERDNLNLIREEMIECIKKIKLSHLKQLDDNKERTRDLFEQLSQLNNFIDDVKIGQLVNQLFCKFCIYIEFIYSSLYQHKFHDKAALGALIITNRYFTPDQILKLKKYLLIYGKSPAHPFTLDKDFCDQELIDFYNFQLFIYKSIHKGGKQFIFDVADHSFITRLDLSRSTIQDFRLSQLCLLNKLTVLNLQCSRFSRCDENTFVSMPNLKYLNLSYNKIEILHKNTFNFLPNLVSLNLRYCNLTDFLHCEQFKCLTKLEKLSIANNPHLLFFEDGLFKNLTNLKELDLEKTGLKQIKKNELDSLIQLEYLSLYGNFLKCLDLNLFKSMQKLICLDVGYNEIETILNECVLREMPSLEKFNFKGNPIILKSASNLSKFLLRKIYDYFKEEID